MLSSPSVPSPDTGWIPEQPELGNRMKASDTYSGQLSKDQKAELIATLDCLIGRGLFPTDPKRVPACMDGELTLPLIDESQPPIGKKRCFSPQEIEMITEEFQTFLDRGVIRSSNSP